MFGIGMQELVIILIIVLLLFGATKIPQLAKAMGKSIGSFKKGVKESEEEIKKLAEDQKDEINSSEEKKDS